MNNEIISLTLIGMLIVILEISFGYMLTMIYPFVKGEEPYLSMVIMFGFCIGFLCSFGILLFCYRK